VVHGISTQHHGVLGPRALHRGKEPEDRVVLLFHDSPVGRFDDVQRFLGHGMPHFDGMASTLSDASQNEWKSAGEPRRVSATNSPTPRSSTHIPQFTQSTLPPFFAASASRAVTWSLVVGWFSSARFLPCTGFGCGPWLPR